MRQESSTGNIDRPEQWARLLLGLGAVFALFESSARWLGSDRGQAGLIVASLVVAAAVGIERLFFVPTMRSAAHLLGLARPRATGLIVSGAACLILFAVVPAFARATGASATLLPGSLALLPGLFAQAGIAEETLFRGYLFRHLRRHRTFWHAAGISMIPFVAVHLILFLSMPWIVALGALLLAVVLSFPLAHLFELGGNTIWAPALLHFTVQATVKVADVGGGSSPTFPLVWMAASAVVPQLVFLARRRP